MSKKSRITCLLDEGMNAPILDFDEKSADAQFKEDETLMIKGRAYFEAHIFSSLQSMLVGLLSLMYIPSIVELLSFTQKSSTSKSAFKRYLSTLNHVIDWFKDSESFKQSLRKVRKLHISAEKNGKINGNLNGITQYDLVITQWAFVGPFLLKPGLFGVRDSSKDIEGFIKIMYWLGHYLGIDPKYNLCSGSYKETIHYSNDILQIIIRPSLVAPTSDLTEPMKLALLEGIEKINLFILPLSFSKWSHYVLGSSIEKNVKLDWKSFAIYILMHIVMRVLMILPIIGSFITHRLNTLMKINIKIANQLSDNISD